ncbi:hypothetical protein [Micromonospora sp. DH14]|uniref:hypothetical protein n=1 Tax=Micromonospora sp. DH14 TaxID=3040120 RepID=UPI0024415CE7|nr:hypothetical protein [Micromonospora sp. DH14]MDG9674857.1 hypothetical protein [Micromonospora sp. DH14]
MTDDALPREEADRFGGPDTEPAAVAASARVSYQLTYARSPVTRRFSPGELTGPDIPCAYDGPIAASGYWEDSRDLDELRPDRTDNDWIGRYAGYALAEAIHEALEWLRVDGQPWLDPHGRHGAQVHAAVDDLVDHLVRIRSGVPPGDRHPEDGNGRGVR